MKRVEIQEMTPQNQCSDRTAPKWSLGQHLRSVGTVAIKGEKNSVEAKKKSNSYNIFRVEQDITKV